MLRVLIVDDEPPARGRLRALLEVEQDVEVMGECGSAAEALELIHAVGPDLVFLDIELPGVDGFRMLESLAHRPAVIFVTAFGEHAVRAFDVSALDYLLKPVSRERFRQALDRARVQMRPRVPLYRLPVGAGRRIQLLATEEIDYIRSERNYLRVHAGSRSYLLRDTLTRLESRLDPGQFVRIHRSLIVRVDRIREIETLDHGELALTLPDGVVLVAGRGYGQRLRWVLGL